MANSFLDAMNRSIPTRHVPIKSATPWITNDIKRDIARRERMFRKAKRSNSQDHVSRYKRIRNSIITKIRVAKKSFFKKLSHPMALNRKFWSIIRSANPSKSLSAVLFLMAQSQSMVSRTKPISLSILLPVLTRHLFHLLFHIC